MSPMSMLTSEQLEWIEQQVHRAADKAARRTRNRALVGFAVLLFAIGFVQWDSSHKANGSRDAITESGTVIAVDGCNRDFVSRKEIRGVLERSMEFQKAALDRGDITQAQYDRGVQFYKDRLEALPLPDCRRAADILTSNPDQVPPVPTPLHP